jgi:hypothetical protein
MAVDCERLAPFRRAGMFAPWAAGARFGACTLALTVPNRRWPDGSQQRRGGERRREERRAVEVTSGGGRRTVEHRAASVCSVSQSVVAPLERVVSRAFGMFSAGAFLHHYRKFGVDEVCEGAMPCSQRALIRECAQTHFAACFAHLETILGDYRALGIS